MHAHTTRTLLILLALIALVVGFVYAVFFYGRGVPQSGSQATVSDTSGFPQDAPAPTPQDYVSAQKGFQYLVSYTDNGFAPPALSVGENETVRFTNNSNNPLRLSLENAQVTSLNHGEYYEYTFANAGTFAYSDSISEMTVTVK